MNLKPCAGSRLYVVSSGEIDPVPAGSNISAEMWAVDPAAPLYDVKTKAAGEAGSTGPKRHTWINGDTGLYTFIKPGKRSSSVAFYLASQGSFPPQN